jgi:hypothetical protein
MTIVIWLPSLLYTVLHQQDTVANTKRYGMEAARDLLESKPTGEAQLLSILVNKFGDPDRKVSSRAIHLLQVCLNVLIHLSIVLCNATTRTGSDSSSIIIAVGVMKV